MNTKQPLDTETDPIEWARLAAQTAEAKGGIDPQILAVGDVLAILDAFVITSANNDRLVRTLANEIERAITEAGGPKPSKIEGLNQLEWVLMDYGDFVVHIFLESARRFYDLEHLWSDVPRITWESTVPRAANDG